MITENGETFFLLGDKKLPSLQIELVTADGKLVRHQFPRLELVTCLTDAHKNQIMGTIDISSESAALQGSYAARRAHLRGRPPPAARRGGHLQVRVARGGASAPDARLRVPRLAPRGRAQRRTPRDGAVARVVRRLGDARAGALALACTRCASPRARALTGETAGLVNLAWAALNLSVSHFWGACLLLNIVHLSPRLQNIAACFLPIIDLVMVGVVLLCVVYVFAVLVFVAFAADLGDRAADCASLWGCFKMTLSGGVRSRRRR